MTRNRAGFSAECRCPRAGLSRREDGAGMTTTEQPLTTARLSDAELISAVRAGDQAAYGTLYERHAGAARRLAGQYLPGAADADDVVAETCARVLRVIRRGRGPEEAFRPYLLASVRRVAIDQLRSQRVQIPTDD